MQKNILGLAAIALAVTLSSYTTVRSVDYFLIYDGGTADQTILSSYDNVEYETSAPDHEDQPGAVLNWLKVVDANSNGVESSELSAAFAAFDQGPTSGTLNDEADIHSQLDIK